MKIIVVILCLVAGSVWADRASDRAAIQSILGATNAQMDSLEIWYPGTDVVVDFTDRVKHYFMQYKDALETKNGKDRTSQIAVKAAEDAAAVSAAAVVAKETEKVAALAVKDITIAVKDSVIVDERGRKTVAIAQRDSLQLIVNATP